MNFADLIELFIGGDAIIELWVGDVQVYGPGTPTYP